MMNHELQNLCDTYASSKILRLGAAYLDTAERFRHLIAEETGLSTHTLQEYGHISREYFHTHISPYSKWTDEEDNIVMANYQRMTLRGVMKLLPGRSVFTIKKRAAYLGVTKER